MVQRHGAGLCSPGRWPFDKRKLPDNDTLTTARDLIKNFVTQHLSTDLFAKPACGRIENCPFKEGIVELREEMCRLFQQTGQQPRRRNSDEESPLEIRLLGAFLKSAGDPETDLPSFAEGVRVGVGIQLPRVPAVYSRKRKWRLTEQEDPDAYLWYDDAQGADNENYASAKELAEAVKEQLELSVAIGQAMKLTEEEARKKYGDSHRETLQEITCCLERFKSSSASCCTGC